MRILDFFGVVCPAVVLVAERVGEEGDRRGGEGKARKKVSFYLVAGKRVANNRKIF